MCALIGKPKENFVATGRVKWFDVNKGFGFITPDDRFEDLADSKTSLDVYGRYMLEAKILDDEGIMNWFGDICAGKSPTSEVAEEILAMMQGRGLVRKTDFGWVLGAEGRQFARNLGLIAGPSKIEIDPSLVRDAEVKDEKEQKANIATLPPLEKVWADFAKTGSRKCRNLLVQHYRPIVKYIAEGLHAKLPEKVDFDDLISAGIFGLMDAIDTFDPTRGVKFETYCSPRIRGAILDELRSMDWVPRSIRARADQLAKTSQTFEISHGRKPTEEGDKEVGFSLRECDVKNFLIKNLNKTESLIIVMYYYQEMTMKEIATTLDMSESRVAQMHSSILARLKGQLNDCKHELLQLEEAGELPQDFEMPLTNDEKISSISKTPMLNVGTSRISNIKDLYTASEAAEICRVSQQNIIRCFDSGKLEGFRVPGSKFRRIPRASLVKFMKENNIPLDGLKSSGKTRVLVVDDDPTIVELISEVLTRDGRYEIKTASSGYTAGIVTQQFRPDVILLDYMLPDVNGNIVCQTIRKNPEFEHIKIIIFSSVMKQDEVNQMLHAGAQVFIKKPFSVMELPSKITQVLQAR